MDENLNIWRINTKQTLIMKKKYLFVLLIVFGIQLSHSQTYFGGKFKISNHYKNGHTYTVYDFSREGTVVRAKYFAQNAYYQYQQWKGDREILLVTAGAFSDTFKEDGKPVGLCVDNGVIVNRVTDDDMDGLVIVYNGSAQIGGIAIVDLDKKAVKCESSYGGGSYEYYYPRSSYTDRVNLLNWGANAGLTLFQTQLVYSDKKSSDENFNNLYYGKKRERRFLAICLKYGDVHHVVVDVPENEYLNLAAKNAKSILDDEGFNVLYIMNLDTGGKNILHRYNGYRLENLEPNSNEDARIEKATNLLIYYKE